MSFVVDTCVLLDVALDDPKFGKHSAVTLERYQSRGLVISPLTFIELAPQFDGDLGALQSFCEICGVDYSAGWNAQDTELSARSFALYVEKRRQAKLPKRPVADILIGAFACRFKGLITRNPRDFRPYFPRLKLVVD